MNTIPALITVEQDEDGTWNARAVLGDTNFVYGFGDSAQEARADVRAGLQDVFDHEGVPGDLVPVNAPDAVC